MFQPRALPRSLSAALRDAADAKADVRRSAVAELGRFRAEAKAGLVLDQLVRSLSTDKDHRVRSQAAVALADLGEKRAEAALLRAAQDEHPRVRQMVLLALGELGSGSDDALRLFRAACRDGLPGLRFQGLIALANSSRGEAKRELERALVDEDAEVRYIAVRLIEEHFESSQRSADMSKAVERLLTDSEPSVRLAAALVAAREDVREAYRVIAAMLNANSEIRDPEDEAAAIALAGDAGLSEAIPGLRRRLGGWLVRKPFDWHARVALGQLGDQDVLRRLFQDLASRNAQVRAMALAAVARGRLRQAKPFLEAMTPRDDEERESVTRALDALGDTKMDGRFAGR